MMPIDEAVEVRQNPASLFPSAVSARLRLALGIVLALAVGAILWRGQAILIDLAAFARFICL